MIDTAIDTAMPDRALFMWGVGWRWRSFAVCGAAGAARRCLTGVAFLSYRLDEAKKGAPGTGGVLEYGPGAVGHFHYRQVLGLVARASSEKTVLEAGVYVELVGRAQMTNADDIQESPGSVFF